MQLLGLLAQHGHAAGADAGRRHPGRRRDRRDREHRAAHAHGQNAATRPRWRPPTRSAGGAWRRPWRIVVVFLPVSFMGGMPASSSTSSASRSRRGAVLAAGRAPGDAADGRLLPEGAGHEPSTAKAARWTATCDGARLGAGAPLDRRFDRRGLAVRRLDRRWLPLLPTRLHAGQRPRLQSVSVSSCRPARRSTRHARRRRAGARRC